MLYAYLSLRILTLCSKVCKMYFPINLLYRCTLPNLCPCSCKRYLFLANCIYQFLIKATFFSVTCAWFASLNYTKDEIDFEKACFRNQLTGFYIKWTFFVNEIKPLLIFLFFFLISRKFYICNFPEIRKKIRKLFKLSHCFNLITWAVAQEVFCKNGVLKNLAGIRRKTSVSESRFQSSAGLGLWHRCFPMNFTNFLKIPFFIGHLRWLLLYLSSPICFGILYSHLCSDLFEMD